MNDSNIIEKTDSEAITLFNRVVELIETARLKISTNFNLAMVHTYFEIGKMIIEEEQKGNKRAEYGKSVLKQLSAKLTTKFGKGFSVENLDKMRFFYNVYSNSISSTVLTKFDKNEISNSLSALNNTEIIQKFQLSWSHYLILMRIQNPNERKFYEIESKENNWSLNELKRQYHSSLYERLALSRNKEEVINLSKQGQLIAKPQDIFKNPLSLEFLGLEERVSYSESDLEYSIINRLQYFLLELGKGFLFESRQKRFTFDNDHFYVDLVFYNRLLQCYVLIDLKTDKLTHQDLGQMQMYVNYYDRFVKKDFEKPTIGILICKKKADALVELTLPKDAQIYASEYSLYLPDKLILQQKLQEWIEEFDEIVDDK
ncbi:MAG: PDDEXK nuclease domain-containing protein [Bacteroidota bacterium]